jgi:hypothetical protein
MFQTSRLFALFLLAVTASGCAIFGGSPPERYGGGATLTQAAQEAAKDSTEKHKRLDVGHEVPPAASGTEVVVEETSEETSQLSESPSEPGGHSGDPSGVVLGVVAGGGSLGGNEYEGFGLGGLDIGARFSDRWRFDLGLLVVSPNLSATSLAGQGLKDEVELAADVSVRYYLTPVHTFLGVYPLVGMRWGTLFWDYVTPVNVIADGGPKTIASDHLEYFGFYGGLGVSLVQVRHFSTGFNLTGGFRAYGDNTFEGFHNTLFPTTGYVQLGVEMVYKF